jgi:hypothetical protein
MNVSNSMYTTTIANRAGADDLISTRLWRSALADEQIIELIGALKGRGEDWGNDVLSGT